VERRLIAQQQRSSVDEPACTHAGHARAPDLVRPEISSAVGGVSGGLRVWLNRPAASLVLASAELGLYSATGAHSCTHLCRLLAAPFHPSPHSPLAGSIAQAWGLTQIPATQAGFLIQFTAVVTPVIALLSGERVSASTLRASALALAGTLLITADGFHLGSHAAAVTSAAEQFAADDAAAALASQLRGDAATLFSAFCYSIATFRISVLAPGAVRVGVEDEVSVVTRQGSCCACSSAHGEAQSSWG